VETDPSFVDPATVTKATPYLHAAVESLIKAWDSIYEAEKILGCEITTMELSDLASGIDHPQDVRRVITQEHLLGWVNEVRVNLK
jgi:hypothetical protein